MIKVAIIEDDAKVREMLTVLVSATRELKWIGSYPNSEMALKHLPRDWPDVIMMDINLPNMSGIECAAKVKEQHPPTQIVMLTAYEDKERIFDSLKAGASGYLLKRASPMEILEAISEVHGGGSPMSSSIARQVVQYFRQRPSKDDTENLTTREVEILELLAQGYLYKEIGEKLSIATGTVRNHLQHIYEKLHVRSRTEAVVKFLSKTKSSQQI
jgi:DNA-binding NarL/FixJ family response regulator